LTDGRNIRSSSTLSDILVFDIEVLTYSTFITGYSRILVVNGFKVLILPYLRKGNSSAVDVNNPSVKLKVVGDSETLTFFS
jgi:hypothetical protein